MGDDHLTKLCGHTFFIRMILLHTVKDISGTDVRIYQKE